MLELLDLPINDCGLDEFTSIKAIKGKNITAQQAMCVAMIKKAMNGDVSAATFVRDTSGNKPKEEKETDGIIEQFANAVILADKLKR